MHTTRSKQVKRLCLETKKTKQQPYNSANSRLCFLTVGICHNTTTGCQNFHPVMLYSFGKNPEPIKPKEKKSQNHDCFSPLTGPLASPNHCWPANCEEESLRHITVANWICVNIQVKTTPLFSNCSASSTHSLLWGTGKFRMGGAKCVHKLWTCLIQMYPSFKRKISVHTDCVCQPYLMAKRVNIAIL